METSKELGWGAGADEFNAINYALLGDYDTAAKFFASPEGTDEGIDFKWAPLFLQAMQDPGYIEAFEDELFAVTEQDGDNPYNSQDLLAVLNSDRYAEMVRYAGPANMFTLSAWYPNSKRVRNSDSFKELVKETNMLDYWQAGDWPDQCRPVGDDDFECD